MSVPRHARRDRRTARRAVFVLLAMGATTTVGVGIASWSANGVSLVGTESAGTTATKQALTVTTTAPSGMYPTQANAGNVVATITNPNNYNVTLISGSVSAVSGCVGIALSDFTFGAAVLTTPVAVKASGANGVITIPITAVNNSLPDACAAAGIKFQVTASGASS